MPIALIAAGILQPEEIAMLNQVYDQLASEPFFLADKLGREALAQHILLRYQTGTTDAEGLIAACADGIKSQEGTRA
jgi:hypothetical protein